MKRLLLTLSLFCTISLSIIAQQNYTVNGESYSLKTEVDGELTLLWNTIDGEYRYFAQKGNTITELKNTKSGREYQEEFKESLQLLTADNPVSTEDVNLTLPSLREYFNTYNKKVDPSFSNERPPIQLKTRIGPFAGISNSIFTQNPENNFLAVAGIDFEIIDEVKLKRHALVVRFKQTFENSDYKFNASQFSLNYRFKFIKSQTIDVFANLKFASYTYSTRDDFLIEDPNTGDIMEQSSSGGDFNAPGTFGLGADYQLGNGYLFFTYNDLVGIGVDSNGEFPLDFTLGYKFNL